MDAEAFADCSSLKKIEIPASLESCGALYGGVFHGTALKEVSFGEGASRVADYLFLGCISIEEIDIPDTVTVIGVSAFHGCANLNRIGIPKNTPITEIQRSAFEGCSQLSAIELPDSITKI